MCKDCGANPCVCTERAQILREVDIGNHLYQYWDALPDPKMEYTFWFGGVMEAMRRKW